MNFSEKVIGMTVETQVDREVDWQNFEDSAMVEVEHRNFLAVVNAKKSLDGFSIPSYRCSRMDHYSV